jgi:hypothetical protein
MSSKEPEKIEEDTSASPAPEHLEETTAQPLEQDQDQQQRQQ